MAKANSNGHAPAAERRAEFLAELIPAAAYYRMSSDQQETSIQDQRTAVQKWAKEHGYRIVREYKDEGIPGWDDRRDGFQTLIKDAERVEFKAVLCWDQNRFSRFPPLEATHYWYLLDRAGVHLATVNQGKIDWKSIAGLLVATINQYGDSQHRHKLSKDVKRGKDAAAERGNWQTTPPYGYVIAKHVDPKSGKTKSGKLMLGDAIQVGVVQRIFREYCDGQSLRSIAHRLNAEGIKARRGAWAAASVQLVLCNPAYLGTFRWGTIEIENNHPAIVDGITAEIIKRLLTERQKVTTHTKSDDTEFLFTGRLRCGKCGSAMVGHKREGTRFYQCNGRRLKGAHFCDHNSCKQDELLESVISALETKFADSRFVERLRKELRRQVSKSVSHANPEQLEKQLANVVDKLTKAKRRLVECDRDMLDVVQQTIRELRDQQTKLEAAIKVARIPKETLFGEQDQRIDDAMKAFSTLRKTVQKAEPAICRQRLRQMINRILVWSELDRERGRQVFQLQRGSIHVGNILSNDSTPP